MNGKIYLVATPIGNLEDITYRAIKVLNEVDLIAAEDTRHTLKLLNHYQIKKPLISYHRHNEDVKTDLVIEKVLQGENVALVSDAGTPGISDPGEDLVQEAIKNGIDIVPIPGACAFVNALIASGLDTKIFSFYGFLPLHKKLREKIFDRIKKEKKTVILYEAPHKIKKTLQDICKYIGDVNCVIAREITKIHEEFIRGKVSEVNSNLEEPKGEFVILLELSYQEIEDTNNIGRQTPEEQYMYYEKLGLEKKEIIKQIAQNMGVSKNEIYQLFLNK